MQQQKRPGEIPAFLFQDSASMLTDSKLMG